MYAVHTETMAVFKTIFQVLPIHESLLTVINLVPGHANFSFSTINTSIYRLTSHAQSQSLGSLPIDIVLCHYLHPSSALSSCLSGNPFHLSGEHIFCSNKGARLFSTTLEKFPPPYLTHLFHKYVTKTYYVLGNVLSVGNVLVSQRHEFATFTGLTLEENR